MSAPRAKIPHSRRRLHLDDERDQVQAPQGGAFAQRQADEAGEQGHEHEKGQEHSPPDCIGDDGYSRGIPFKPLEPNLPVV